MSIFFYIVRCPFFFPYAENVYVLLFLRGYMKPKTGLVKFAVRLRGKNVEIRIATSVAKIGKGEEKAEGVKDIK